MTAATKPQTSTIPTDPLALPGITTDQAAISFARRGQGPDRLWLVDVSQIWGGTAWLYFAYVLDCGTGHCLGWAPHRVHHRDLITEALLRATTLRSTRGPSENQAIARRRFASRVPLVFGRGCHLAGLDFPRWAIPSAADTHLADAFVARMRRDLVDEEEKADRAWASLPEARRAISAWIERSYNPAAARPPRLERGAKPKRPPGRSKMSEGRSPETVRSAGGSWPRSDREAAGRGRLLPRLDGEAAHQQAT